MALRSLYTVIALRDQVSEKIKTVNRRLDTYKTKLQVVRRQLQRVNTTLKEHRMHFLMVGAALGAVIGLTIKGAIDEEKYRRNIASLIGVQSKKNKVLQEYITIAEELSYISKENRARLASEMLLMGASVDSIMKYGPQLEKLGISVGKTTEDVITAVRSSITGIHRPFKNLGIIIEETDVKDKVEEIRDAHEGWTEEALRTEAIMLLAYPQMTRVIGDFDVAMDSAYGDTIKFRETLSDLSGDIGGVFIPLLRAGIVPLTKFMGMLKEHPILRMGVAISLLSGFVLTLAGLAIPMIVSALSFFVPAATAAAFASGGLTAAMSTLAVSIWAVMAPLLPIIAVVALVIGAVLLLQHAWVKNWGDIQGKTKKVTDFLKNVFGWIMEKFNMIKKFLPLLLGPIGAIYFAFKSWDKIKGVLSKTGSAIKTKLGDAIGGITKKLEPIRRFLPLLLGPIGAIYMAFKNWRKIIELLSNLKDVFYDAGTNLIKAFVDGIKAFASAPIDAIKEIGERIRAFLPFSDAKVGPLADLSLAGQKFTETFGAGILKMQPELVMDMQKLFKRVPIIGEGIDKMMPPSAEMISSSATTSVMNAPHSEDKRVSIGKIELHIDSASDNAEEIGDAVISRIKREFEKYGI